MEKKIIIVITVIIKDSNKDNHSLEVLELEFSDLINLFILFIFYIISIIFDEFLLNICQ
jgi:accessory gene regulator protein AgrB